MNIHDLIFYVIILVSPIQLDDGSEARVLITPFDTMQTCGLFDRQVTPIVGAEIKKLHNIDVQEVVGCVPYEDALAIHEQYDSK